MNKCMDNWTELVKNQDGKEKKPAKKETEQESGLFAALGTNPKRAQTKVIEMDMPSKIKKLDTTTTITTNTTSRPMSVDDIRKQKLKEKNEMTKRKLDQVYDAAQPAEESDKKRPKLKKRVTWAPDDKLLNIKIFEKEVGEEQVVQQESSASHPKGNIAALDKQHEKFQLQQQRKKIADMQATTHYSIPPIPFDTMPTVLHTVDSKRQASRVSETLPVKYASPKEIPISPASPLREMEYNESQVPAISMEKNGTYESPYAPKTEALSALQALASNPDLLQSLLGMIGGAPKAQPAPIQQQSQHDAPYMQPHLLPSSNNTRHPHDPMRMHNSSNNPMRAAYPSMHQPMPNPNYNKPNPPQQPYSNQGMLPYPPPHHVQPLLQAPQPPMQHHHHHHNPHMPHPYANYPQPSHMPSHGGLLPPPANMQPSNEKLQPSKSIRCRFYTSKIGCKRGNSCKYYHEGVDAIPPGGVHDAEENEPPASYKSSKRR